MQSHWKQKSLLPTFCSLSFKSERERANYKKEYREKHHFHVQQGMCFLEDPRNAIEKPDAKDQEMISLRYSRELTMDEIGQIYGISKMTVSKRPKKLHQALGSSVR